MVVYTGGAQILPGTPYNLGPSLLFRSPPEEALQLHGLNQLETFLAALVDDKNKEASLFTSS